MYIASWRKLEFNDVCRSNCEQKIQWGCINRKERWASRKDQGKDQLLKCDLLLTHFFKFVDKCGYRSFWSLILCTNLANGRNMVRFRVMKLQETTMVVKHQFSVWDMPYFPSKRKEFSGHLALGEK